MSIQKKEKKRIEKRPESGSSRSFEKLTGLFISFEDMRSNLRKVKGHNVMKIFYPDTINLPWYLIISIELPLHLRHPITLGRSRDLQKFNI